MSERLTAYQKRLFVFLSVATFFEGYDYFALTQVLPELSLEFGLTRATTGYLVALVNAGTIVAYALVRGADRWGRRSVLSITILGYALMTLLSGLAPNIYLFAAFQLLARVFLIGEWAVSMIIAAEEFSARRRGMVIGLISAWGALGSIACAGVAPLLLATSFGWRSVYLVGVVPILILAYARRSLRETDRFSQYLLEQGQGVGSDAPGAEGLPAALRDGAQRPAPQSGLLAIWHSAHRGRAMKMGAIWFFSYVCTQNAITFWKVFAQEERGFSDGDVGRAIVIAAAFSLPMVFVAGRLLDWVGRRWGAVVIFGAMALGTLGAYSLTSYVGLTFSLVLGVFGASSVPIVLNAYTTELFPTPLRASAFAFSNNFVGRIGYVLSPAAIGYLAESVSWGLALRWSVLSLVIAFLLIIRWLPETNSLELEESARLEPRSI